MTTGKLLAQLGLGLLCLAGPTAASAQNTPAMPFGKDVRVVLKNGMQVTGRLVDLTAAEVVVREKRATRHHPLADVQSIETRTHAAKTLALIGTGVALGLSAAFYRCEPKSDSLGGSGEPNCISGEPFLYAVAGAATGAAIGALIDKSRKRALYVAPAGLGARVVIRW